MAELTGFDVAIVGGGAAGLYAALCLPKDCRIALISKKALLVSASDWAQGGIAAAVGSQDSPQLHLEDTLAAGDGLCDEAAVRYLVEVAPRAIASLVELGVKFDRRGEGLAATLEAAHSRPRVLHAADTTGKTIVTTLIERVRERDNIAILEGGLAIDLWMVAGRCVGVHLLLEGQLCWLAAQAVVLATGGGGRVYSQTTNPIVSTGDGVAMAYRAGATLRDLEFFQFHPTALTLPDAPRFLISEATRGEGGHLVDDGGERFCFQYHPDGELAPRDVVSRAIFDRLQKMPSDSANPCVWLDLRTIEPEKLQQRFPNIIGVCAKWGIDVFRAPIPVAPAAHYWMGGIYTDLRCRSDIEGLYAVGETTSTGVHGANRLASNSLLECIVFGAALETIELTDLPKPPVGKSVRRSIPMADIETIAAIRRELPVLMWDRAAICREGEGMAIALTRVQQWQDVVRNGQLAKVIAANEETIVGLSTAESNTIGEWVETRNLLDIASGILNGAIARTESRGGHYRLDFPRPSSEWQCHTIVRGDRQFTGNSAS